MQLKYEWIQSRKQQINKQSQECEAQAKTLIRELFADLKSKEEELSKIKDKMKDKTDYHQDQLLRISTQVKTLEAVVSAKEDQLAHYRQELENQTKSNNDKNEMIQQMTSKMLQLQHSLTVSQEQNQSKVTELTKQLQKNDKQFREQMTQVIRKHQNQLTELQSRLNSQHQTIVSEMKKNNLKLIQKIEAEHQTALNVGSQNTKQNENDYQRVVNQNKKLIISINQLKLKTLNLEASLNTTQQQLKIAGKQTELLKENYRRQNEYLKQEKTQLKQKNKTLCEKIDEYAWQVRQLKMSKEEEINRIRVKIDESFKEVALKAQQEAKKMEKQNEQLKLVLSQKQKDIKQLQQVSLKIKELFQQQEKQLIQLKNEKQQISKKQSSPINPNKIIEQLKAEIIRKNCQIQVMQEQIKRLKAKVNSVANVQEQYAKFKDLMQKQNKMLLSEIVFLREKQKKTKKKENSLYGSNILSELNSEQSKVYQDIQQYKKLIQFMTEEMNEASKKIIEKDMRIEKLEAQIKRYERQLQNR